MQFRKANGALGAFVEDVQISRLTAVQLEKIRLAFDQYSVLVFRDQKLTPAQQISFTESFGEVRQHPLYRSAVLDQYPEILVLEHKTGEWINGRNDTWHADVTFEKKPPLGSVLYCLDIQEGFGDTLFCNMRRAYQSLSHELQSMIQKMTAEHSAVRMIERNNRYRYNVPIESVPDSVIHPVVRTDLSNSPSLFVNPIYTVGISGMTVSESEPLLEFLYTQATRHENIYRHRWIKGDVLIFDNRCTMHYAVIDYGPEMHRLMHRTTAAGSVPT